MNRLQAIARLRELADKLEAATDAPHDDCEGFAVELALHTHYAETVTAERDLAAYWIDALGLAENRGGFGNSVWYSNADIGTHGKVTVHVPNDYYHNAPADLLANRDVHIVEIGGDA